MQKFQGTVTDTNGNPVASARLTVYTENVISPLPIIYTINSDTTITVRQNPLLTDANGEYVFAIAAGQYSIDATGSSAVLNIGKTITQFEPATSSSSGSTPVAVTLNSQAFLADSSWVAPSGVTQATVTCVAGGAGGQGGKSGGLLSGDAGRGGGAGATITRTVPINPGATYAIVIGTGGTGGAASNVSGNDGTDTTFGSLVTASKGLGSGAGGRGTTAGIGGPAALTVVANTSQMIFNGRGGLCAGGDGGAGGANSTGGNGSNGVQMETYLGGVGGLGAGGTNDTAGGGGGGSTPYGAGGDGGSSDSSPTVGGVGGDALAGSGAGGGGGGSGVTTGGAGGDGASGLCIVEWVS